MELNAKDILDQMVQAAKTSFGKNWPGIKDLATWEFKKLANNVVAIERMKQSNSITEQTARLQIELQKNTLKTIILTEAAIEILAVESAINAALNIVSGAVNKAIGWKLL